MFPSPQMFIPPRGAAGLQTSREEKWFERMICLISSFHAEMLQGGDAAGGDARAGEHLPHGLVAWARWQPGHDGSLGTVARWARWHCGSFSHEMALRGTAQSTQPTGPNPGLGQVMCHASPVAVPDCEPCQTMGHAKPRAVPDCEPCQIMSCAKLWATPGHKLCQIVDHARLGAVPNCMPCQPPLAWPPTSP